MIDKIDAVITWVDGDDPKLREKRMKYAAPGSKIAKREDLGGATRYASIGELYWCLRSIQRFAPFIHKIFIVTDSQNPDVKSHVPELAIPVEIVDHSVIFRGYEEYLPTFNSLAIETMIWRIPDLNENFVYLNDDFFLVSQISPLDWFDKEDRPVIYGKPYRTITARMARQWNYLLKGKKVVKFRDTMLNAALLPEVNTGEFVRIQHVPLALKKSLYQKYYESHPETIIQNIRHRFRDIHQYNPQELNHLLAMNLLGSSIVPSRPLLVTMGPSGTHRFQRRMRRLISLNTIKFLCVNSMDEIRKNQQMEILEFLSQRMTPIDNS